MENPYNLLTLRSVQIEMIIFKARALKWNQHAIQLFYIDCGPRKVCCNYTKITRPDRPSGPPVREELSYKRSYLREDIEAIILRVRKCRMRLLPTQWDGPIVARASPAQSTNILCSCVCVPQYLCMCISDNANQEINVVPEGSLSVSTHSAYLKRRVFAKPRSRVGLLGGLFIRY